jgi:nitrite reductase/ring-hydroxylating ferredoxin subunit
MKPPIGLAFPIGWFCVAASTDVQPGAVRGVTFMGQDLVLFRGRSGVLGLVDAYCPHLGAHLGHGGRVEGETLRCPFHGLCFDRSGVCASAHASRARARVRAWPVREKHGLVLAWYHPEACEPDWEVPDLDVEGYSPLLVHVFGLRGHPQETSENSVDTGHLGVVHGYTDLEVLDTRTSGPRLTVDFRFRRFTGKGKLGISLLAQAHVEVHGLGYSFIDLRMPDLGVHGRQFVLSTPTEQDRIELRVAVTIEDMRRLPRVGPFLPRFSTHLFSHAVFSMFKSDVGRDFDIWKNKRYLPSPALSRGDGPIMLYRRWAAQFYPAASGPAS